jgi:hypothetical protein
LFLPIEPDSPKEHVFVFIGTFIWLFCLWLLVARYRKITGKSVGKRTIVLLAILTAFFSVNGIMTLLGFVLAF